MLIVMEQERLNIKEAIIDIISNRRKCDYTVEYSNNAKQSHMNTNKILTAEEHSKMSEIDFKKYFISKESLINWYFSYLSNIEKIDIISLIGREIKVGEIQRILSIGAGPSVIEYGIKKIFGDRIELICVDYDSYIIKNVKRLFPDILADQFDFTQDSINEIIKRYSPDTILMVGSGCSMDNHQLQKFLKEIRSENVKRIYCFEAAIVSKITIGKICLNRIVHLFKEKTYNFNHSFHAYYRTKKETLKIFYNSGWKIKEVRKLDSYPNTFILYK